MALYKYRFLQHRYCEDKCHCWCQIQSGGNGPRHGEERTTVWQKYLPNGRELSFLGFNPWQFMSTRNCRHAGKAFNVLWKWFLWQQSKWKHGIGKDDLLGNETGRQLHTTNRVVRGGQEHIQAVLVRRLRKGGEPYTCSAMSWFSCHDWLLSKLYQDIPVWTHSQFCAI